jgi:hypothetical protein
MNNTAHESAVDDDFGGHLVAIGLAAPHRGFELKAGSMDCGDAFAACGEA